MRIDTSGQLLQKLQAGSAFFIGKDGKIHSESQFKHSLRNYFSSEQDIVQRNMRLQARMADLFCRPQFRPEGGAPDVTPGDIERLQQAFGGRLTGSIDNPTAGLGKKERADAVEAVKQRMLAGLVTVTMSQSGLGYHAAPIAEAYLKARNTEHFAQTGKHLTLAQSKAELDRVVEEMRSVGKFVRTERLRVPCPLEDTSALRDRINGWYKSASVAGDAAGRFPGSDPRIAVFANCLLDDLELAGHDLAYCDPDFGNELSRGGCFLKVASGKRQEVASGYNPGTGKYDITFTQEARLSSSEILGARLARPGAGPMLFEGLRYTVTVSFDPKQPMDGKAVPDYEISAHRQFMTRAELHGVA
ncbi:MAG: hypothetical protein HUK26_07455 [Duodenibacillus sp.]|nr:hypothetical protein [Duodenibacillus sp.]